MVFTFRGVADEYGIEHGGTCETHSTYAKWLFSLGFNPRFFCGVKFSRPLGPNEIELSIPNDHVLKATNNKTMVKVSIITPIIRASIWV